MRPDRLATTPEEIEEFKRLRLIAHRFWATDWERVAESNPLAFPFCCSVSYGPTSVDTLDVGEELPGSWHQQQNGGRRFWTSVCGEFEAR